MQLQIKNIGSINNSTFTIDGITVLTGVNNTGKSTVSKVLYSTFNSLFNYKEEIRNIRVESLLKNTILEYFRRYLLPYFIDNEESNTVETLKRFYESLTYQSKDIDDETLVEDISSLIHNLISEYESDESDSNYSEIKEFVQESLLPKFKISNEDLFKGIMNKFFADEFDQQINNIWRNDNEAGYISLKIKEEVFKVTVEKQKATQVLNPINLRTRAIYLDNPNILGSQLNSFNRRKSNRTHYNHRDYVLSCLHKTAPSDIVDEFFLDKKLQAILDKLKPIVTGELSHTDDSIEYNVNNSEKSLSFNNISSGLKTFIIIQQLIRNRTLEKEGTLILDEPEIHLHPEWQIVLAELIVLLQLNFNLHILLTTHSPYFLNAIEIFTRKYETEKNTNYYLAENSEEGNNFKNVNKNLSEVYKKLLEPFQKLENAKYDEWEWYFWIPI